MLESEEGKDCSQGFFLSLFLLSWSPQVVPTATPWYATKKTIERAREKIEEERETERERREESESAREE